MVEWEFPQAPNLNLDLPGAPRIWLDAIRTWANAEPQIAAVYLFGSRLRHDFRDDSDLDLAILLSREPDFDPARPFWRCNHNRVERELAALVPVQVHLNVLHLTEWDDTTHYVRETGLAIFVNEGARQHFGA